MLMDRDVNCMRIMPIYVELCTILGMRWTYCFPLRPVCRFHGAQMDSLQQGPKS